MKAINRLNDLLGSDLGRNPFGEPLYVWRFSDDWLHQYLSQTDFTWNDKPVEGSSAMLAVCEPVVKERKMCPTLQNQWVLAKWCDAGPEDAWRKQFGNKLPWPRRGYHAPTNVHLDPGEFPDVAVTLEVIGKIRADRKRTFADFVNDSQDAVDHNDRADSNLIDDVIRNEMTAFYNPRPGARGNFVSLPTVEKFSR